MRIAYVTAGAAGMYCGSCMRDNTLAAALCRQGHEALLIPTYTPIRTDEEDVSDRRVFLGGINIYLQEHSRLFRWTPRFIDRWLDSPRLLRWVSRFARQTRTEQLGGLTISMLQGDQGRQRKEMDRLSAWLTEEFRPDVVILSNMLISGIVPSLRKRWRGPVLATLQGDDIFLEGLMPNDRAQAIALIRQNGEAVAGYLVPCRAYADFMAEYLGLPRDRMHIVPPGIKLAGHGGRRPVRTAPPYTLGYFARICPEKGLHRLVDAYCRLRRMPGVPECRLRIGGWLGENQRPFLLEQMGRLRQHGVLDSVEHIDCPTHEAKVRFLQSLDVFSVPTVYQEPKGIYLLEAWANGVPVVQPNHGAFPELVTDTGGGELVAPDQPDALAEAIARLLADPERRQRLADRGAAAVADRYHADAMAARTVAVLKEYLPSHPSTLMTSCSAS